MNQRSGQTPGSKILIVENSNVQTKIISQYIQVMTGFETLAAHSMHEMLEQIAAYGDDIFLCVIGLILSDAPFGEAVDEAMRQGVPCIVLTADFNEKTRGSFIEKNVLDYFLKGFKSEMDAMVKLIERVRKNTGIKVLVADDSRTSRKHMVDLAANQMFIPLEAVDGVQALEILQDNLDVKLLITDYDMPRMDGFELVIKARERYGRERLAIIGVSGLGSGPLSAKFLKHGANDFLTKPFEVEEFKCRVNQVIETLEAIEKIKEYK